jgi:hypothetical protein|tara:strand:- start:12306 stop:12983 length:678 start_codon:yes stop_codon:yes gene_type:complete
MSEIQLTNTKILQHLNNLKDDFFSKPNYDDKKYRVRSKNWNHCNIEDFYCSRTYLDYLLRDESSHLGYPEEHMAQPISYMEKVDPDLWTEFRKKARIDFTLEIGAQHAALTNYYPPGGFVGWHTNWDANAYQVLFTWSRTGDGYFRYYDKKNDEIITVEDKPGWQARHYYFGRKDELDHHCWHSAFTWSDRITLAYKFDNVRLDSPYNKTAILLRDQLIEELETL